MVEFDRISEDNVSVATSSTSTCEAVLDELPDTRGAENEASRSVKEQVVTANKGTKVFTINVPFRIKPILRSKS